MNFLDDEGSDSIEIYLKIKREEEGLNKDGFYKCLDTHVPDTRFYEYCSLGFSLYKKAKLFLC